MAPAVTSPTDSTLESKKKVPFKRNYSACLNCRTRKVKCDLGSVENPHDPPCARCKRERKECVFVESKRGTSKIKAHHPTSTPLTQPHHHYVKSSTKEISINPILPLPSPYFHQTTSAPIMEAPNTNSQFTPSHMLFDQTLDAVPHSTNPNLNSNANKPANSDQLQVPQIDTPRERENSKASEDTSSNNNSPLPSINSSIQNLTNNATMIYLAHVAGKVAHADSRDHINGAERLSQLERSVPIPRSISNTNNADEARRSSYMNSDSNSSPNNNAKDTEPIRDSFGHDNSLYPIISEDRLTVPPLTTAQSMRQRPTSALSNIEYILPSNQHIDSNTKSHCILTEIEARRLIKIFFVTMHPFYPYIPMDLRDPDVLAGYPMFLCALLAISSRYNPLPDKIGAWDNIADNDTEMRRLERGEKDINVNFNHGERHLAVHEQLWIYCQRLMSMTVWGESSSRSVGTLLTFLMFTEWNPRAIHFRWGDYANGSNDDSLANKKFDKNKNVGRDDSKNKSSKSPPKNTNVGNDEDENDEEFAGLSAMKRSEIMSFMLIGTATRLSFLLDSDPLIFIATHVSEIHIAIGLNKKSMLQQTLSEVDVNDPSLQFTSYQKANIELLQFFSLCYETLYGTRPKFISLDKYQTLAILDILSPILENWYRKYYKLLKPSNIHCAPLAACNDDGSPDWLYLISMNPKLERDLTVSVERESLILDYYYTKLYLYSLALSGDTSVNATIRNSKKGRNLRLDELARYSRYVELAYKAAKEVLAIIQRVRKLRLLKYMPVRWVTRVIKSVSFIVKCYLTLTTDIHTNSPLDDENGFSKNESKSSDASNNADSNIYDNDVKEQNTNGEILKLSVIPLEEIIILLQKTAICLRYAAPDELHLCTRYSTILMYLCSQFKTQMRERNEKNNNSVREYEKDEELEMAGSDSDSMEDDNGVGETTERQEAQNLDQGVYMEYQQVPHQQSQSQLQPQQQVPLQQMKNDNIESLLSPPSMNNAQIFNAAMYNVNTTANSRGASVNPNNWNANNTVKPADPNTQYPSLGYDVENINFSNANQELFDDFFNKNPSEKLFNFFSLNDNNNPGLDFVDQFTKEMEKDFLSRGGKH